MVELSDINPENGTLQATDTWHDKSMLEVQGVVQISGKWEPNEHRIVDAQRLVQKWYELLFLLFISLIGENFLC